MAEIAQPPTGWGGQGTTALGGTSDGNELAAFLDQLREFLRDVINSPLMRDEWRISFRGELSALDPSFELAKAQLRQPAIQDYLQVAGLAGNALQLKLTVGRFYHGLADRLGKPLRAVHGFLSVANVILGSLLAIPGIEPIKEFKELTEAAIDASDIEAEGPA